MISAMKSVSPSGVPSLTPTQAHLRARALIGTSCRSTAQAPSAMAEAAIGLSTWHISC